MQPVLFSPRATVLDCGAECTTWAAFRRSGARLRLENLVTETHPRADENGDRWLEDTRVALRALRQKVKASGPLTLILPATLVFTKLLKVPRVSPAKLTQVLSFEAEQNIPFALADVVWDGAIVAENGATLEILLAAAKREVIEQLCDAAHEAGFEPRIVLPAALGTLAAFRLVAASPAETSLVLNLSPRSATLLLVERTRVSARSFRFGFGCESRQAAPGMDLRAGGAGTGEAIAATSPESPAARLAQEVMRSVLHFRRQDGTANPERLFLAGIGCHLVGLAETLATKLNIRVGLLDFRGAVENASGACIENLADLTDAIGAAAIQLRPNQPVLNLLPVQWRLRDSFRQRQPWLVAAMVLAVAALVPVWVHFHSLAVEVEKKVAAMERQLEPLRARDQRNQASLRRLERLKLRVAVLDDVAARRSSWIGLLSDLQERLSGVGDVWLEKLQPMPAAKGGVPRLAVSGRMLDKANPQSKVSPATFDRVKALLAGIAESPFVAGVEAERFDNHQPGILKFDFVILPDPQRPL